MRKRNRRRHQLWRFIAGKTEHQSLIAGALFGSTLSFSRSLIDSLFDIARLFAHFTNHPACVGVKNAIAIDISDVADGGAHALLKVKLRVAGYLPGEDDEIAFGERFASHAAQRILLKTSVENVIADGIANFIGMTFGNGFGRKDVTTGHGLKNVETLKRSVVVDVFKVVTTQRFNDVTLSQDILTNHDAWIYRWPTSWRQP